MRGSLFGTLICAGIAAVNAATSVEISITSPKKDAVVKCDRKTPDGYCVCPVQGKVSGLGNGQYICTFMQFSGGSEWWVSGNCLDASQVVDGEWEQSWSSCGKDNEKGTIIIRAMVLDRPEKSGSLKVELPKAIAEVARRIKKQ